MPVIESFGENGICSVCKRNPVNRWCDYVVSYDNAVTFVRDYKEFIAINSGNDYQTCDLPMCDKCATNVSIERDLCPHHMSLHRQAQLPDEYQRRRVSQARAEMYRGEGKPLSTAPISLSGFGRYDGGICRKIKFKGVKFNARQSKTFRTSCRNAFKLRGFSYTTDRRRTS